MFAGLAWQGLAKLWHMSKMDNYINCGYFVVPFHTYLTNKVSSAPDSKYNSVLFVRYLSMSVINK